MDRAPSIAAIGVVGRHNNPLHISIFPATGSTESQYATPRDTLEYTMMLNSCLDIFEARIPSKSIGHDFGLLHALDERIAMYGWLLNTGVKLIIVVDMEGRQARSQEEAKLGVLGLRNSDLAPAFHALQTAYVNLLRNPFYVPDEHDPKTASQKGNMQIRSAKFIKEVERVGQIWFPGMTAI
ncbi:Putative trafficking protein particle complex subunit 2 [Septoria linicola]|uniref:Trafficking protein particle complex subunit 2 n=1 Tax=Septoria linicola TaxID=215465 RepID=A0A9Q9B4E8_9PEZI|nr:Putative trafficking protein particle complex subunit 2 [Septoria linicola]